MSTTETAVKKPSALDALKGLIKKPEPVAEAPTKSARK